MDIKLNKNEALKSQLIEISSHISVADRLKVAVNLGLSPTTVKRYLAGEVGSEARAERILKEAKRIAA